VRLRSSGFIPHMDPSELSAWRKMCRVVGIVPPLALEGCRAVSNTIYPQSSLLVLTLLTQAIKQLYTNMVDLEHEGHLGNVDSVPRFTNGVALRKYSQGTGRFTRRRWCRAQACSSHCNAISPILDLNRRIWTTARRKVESKEV